MSSVAHSIINFLSGLDGFTAYGAIVGLLLVCGLGVPLPEDVTLIAAGILSTLGSVTLPGAIAAGLFGVLVGDAFMFSLGRIYGRRAFRLPIIRSIMTPKRIPLAERKVIRNSKFICFTARFLPGLRSPIFLTSGILGVPALTFFSLDGAAALISVPLWIFGGRFFGENLDVTLKYAERVQFSLLGVIVLLIVAYSWRGRLKKMRRGQKLTQFMRHERTTEEPPPQLPHL
jgi:membrane protein DedA with SNARE-associated domain